MEAPGGLRLYVVQSGSMEPYIKTGSLAVTKRESEYKTGDVISFTNKSGGNFAEYGQTIMHRIVEETNEDGETIYTTKGDANQGSDPDPVLPSRIKGRVLFSLPYVGYAVSFARTKPGFISLIAIPAAIIVFLEVLTIKKELQRMIAERKNKKSEKVTSEKLSAVKAVSLLCFTSSVLFLASATGTALLADTEIATGVSISVGTWGNDPQLTCEFRGEKHMFHFALDGGYAGSGIVSYSLVYIADDIQHEVLGEGLEFTGFFEKEICLGGSSDECTPHDNFDRLELNVDLEESVGHEQRQLRCRFRWRENQWNEED